MELKLRPSDIERISNRFSFTIQDPRCVISHSTLAGIEAGALPSIYKILSLAYCLRLTENQILEWYEIDLNALHPMLEQRARLQSEALSSTLSASHETRFPFQWPTELASPKTELFLFKSKGIMPAPQQRFRYARIGSQDDSMMEILPPSAIVRVDTHQQRIVTFPWQSLRHRPIYLVWHHYGHTCCWCQQNGSDTFLVYHPASHYPVRRLRTSRDVTVVGRVVSAWPDQGDASFDFPSY